MQMRNGGDTIRGMISPLDLALSRSAERVLANLSGHIGFRYKYVEPAPGHFSLIPYVEVELTYPEDPVLDSLRQIARRAQIEHTFISSRDPGGHTMTRRLVSL